MKYAKALGLAVVAALALTAFVGAGSASAFTKAHCANSKGIIPTGTKCTLDIETPAGGEPAEFKTDAGTISCNKTTAMASFLGGDVTEIESEEIKYSECTFLGVVGVAVNMGTCQYNFHINGEVDVTPKGCGPISFTAAGCTVTVPSQTGLKTAAYENMAGPPKDVTILPNGIKEIEYNSSALCPNGEHKGLKNGEYKKGKVTVKGTAPAGTAVDFTVE